MCFFFEEGGFFLLVKRVFFVKRVAFVSAEGVFFGEIFFLGTRLFFDEGDFSSESVFFFLRSVLFFF